MDEPALLQAIAEHKAVGNKHYQQQEYDAACAAYAKAVKLFPDFEEEEEVAAASGEVRKQAAIVLCNRSAAHMGSKRAVAALADAQRAADFDAGNWKAHWRTGLALMMMEIRLERSEKAVAAFQRTIECTSLPAGERENVTKALGHARYRLQEGRDALDMPDMSACVLS